MTVRIVSLLPSATEIVCALGVQDDLVGISHECDHPTWVQDRPVLTSARLSPRLSSKGIDTAVRSVLRDALAVYDIDTRLLAELAPDVIVTQDLCDVCAVSFSDVCAAVQGLTNPDVQVVSLRPQRLADIWADLRSTGLAIGRAEEAERVVADLERRVAAVRERTRGVSRRPSVLAVEWTDPVMIAGMWLPELIEIAGGTPLVTAPGESAPTLDHATLAALDPDIVLVKPCGFDLERTLGEREILRSTLPWDDWRAVGLGQVYVADGNAYFNRPGPRIVDSLEILAACVHPERFPEFRRAYAHDYVRLTPELDVERFDA